MESKFDNLVSSLLEMAVTFKDTGNIKPTISDIRDKNLPHHYQKPLVAIADDRDRDEMIDKIIEKVFGFNNFNDEINTKKELQDALEKAVIEVSKSAGSKFNRPVTGVSASYLGRWLGTNINVEYSRSGSAELANDGASAVAAKDILNKTLTPTEDEKEELKKETPLSEPSIQGGGDPKDNPLNKEYSFDENAFEQFKAQIDKTNKRNDRYGIPVIQIEELGEEFVDVKERAAGTRFFDDILRHTLPAKKIRKVKFKLVVPELRMDGGWEFIGRVDHEAIGNLIVSVPGAEHGVDLHKMFGNSEPSYCDHCNTTRRRTSTFVLKNPEGKIKRVGRQCLKDYLPGGERGVSEIVGYAQYLSDIAERLRIWESKSGGGDYDEEGMGGGGRSSKEHFSVQGTVALAKLLVDKIGYVSKAKASQSVQDNDGVGGGLMSTADLIDGLYNVEHIRKEYPDILKTYKEDSEKLNKEAKDIIDWADTYLDKQLEDQYNKMREYYQNLSTIVKGVRAKEDAYIPKKYLGYLISIVPLFIKHAESSKADARLQEQGDKVSKYIGYVGMPIGELSAADKRKIKEHNKNFPSTPINLDEFPFNGPIDVTVNSARTFQRQSYSYYDSGMSYMYSMTDDNGNVYVYFASNDLGMNEGEKAKIVRATVKNHKDYTTKSGKTIKQTYVTRVTFE